MKNLRHHVTFKSISGIVLLLFALLFVRFVPRAFDFVMGADQELLPAKLQRTSTVGVREILRLVFLLAIGLMYLGQRLRGRAAEPT